VTKKGTQMKNIARLALAFAVATIACFGSVAHADDQAFTAPGGGSMEPSYTRYYDYWDQDGQGRLIVQDGPKKSYGREITVELSQNGQTFYGEGKRSYASSGSGWLAYCEFWLYGSGTSAKFEGYIPIYPGFDGGGSYFYYGSNQHNRWEVSYDYSGTTVVP
jgi:hypothetical protein